MSTVHIFGPAGLSSAEPAGLGAARPPAHLVEGEKLTSIINPPKRMKFAEQENISPPLKKSASSGPAKNPAVLAPRSTNTSNPALYTRKDLETALINQHKELQESFEKFHQRAIAEMKEDCALRIALSEKTSQLRIEVANGRKQQLEDYIILMTNAYGLPPPPQELNINMTSSSMTQRTQSQSDMSKSIPRINIMTESLDGTSSMQPISPSLSFDDSSIFSSSAPALACFESFESLFEGDAYESKLLDTIASPIRSLSPVFDRIASSHHHLQTSSDSTHRNVRKLKIFTAAADGNEPMPENQQRHQEQYDDAPPAVTSSIGIESVGGVAGSAATSSSAASPASEATSQSPPPTTTTTSSDTRMPDVTPIPEVLPSRRRGRPKGTTKTLSAAKMFAEALSTVVEEAKADPLPPPPVVRQASLSSKPSKRTSQAATKQGVAAAPAQIAKAAEKPTSSSSAAPKPTSTPAPTATATAAVASTKASSAKAGGSGMGVITAPDRAKTKSSQKATTVVAPITSPAIPSSIQVNVVASTSTTASKPAASSSSSSSSSSAASKPAAKRSSAKNKAQDPELFVRGLPPTANLEVLKSYFAPIKVLSFTPGLSGTGFIQFESPMDAANAQKRTGSVLHGSTIELMFDT